MSFDVIDQLRDEILGNPSGNSVAGGLLIGRKRSRPGPLKVVDFVPLPPESDPSGPDVTVSPARLAEVMKRCPSDSQVAGFYRIASDHHLHLLPEDLACIERSFRDPSHVFLVIASKEDSRVSGAFFVRQGNSVGVDPLLTFPFSTAELASGGWATQAGEPLEQSKLAEMLAPVTDFFEQTSIRAKIAIVVGLIALVSTVIVTRRDSSAAVSNAPTPAKLGLRVDRQGANFLIAWDRSVREIAGAKAGNLLISDGSSPPTFVSLTPEQMKEGNMTYTSPSLGDKVELRLDVLEGSGTARTESIISISGKPDLELPVSDAAPPAPSSPTAEDRSGGEKATVAAKPPEPPPALVPTVRKPDGVASKIAAAPPPAPAKIAPPAAIAPPVAVKTVRPEAAKPRAFVPPGLQAARSVSSEGSIPEPPSIFPDSQVLSEYQLLSSLATSSPARRAPQPRSDLLRTTSSIGLNTGVTITSEPSGAKVEIDGIVAGYTPITLKVTPLGLGFTVTLTKDGFAKWMAQTFSTAQPYGLHAQLRELPKEPPR